MKEVRTGPREGKGLCQGQSKVSGGPGLEPRPLSPEAKALSDVLQAAASKVIRRAHHPLHIPFPPTAQKGGQFLLGLQTHTPHRPEAIISQLSPGLSKLFL